MRVCVHAGALSEKNLHGIGFYTLNILRELSKLNNSSYTLYSNKEFQWKIAGDNVTTKVLNFPYGWSYLRLPVEFAKNKYDIAFIPKEVCPPFLSDVSVITVFDLMHLHFPGYVTKAVKRHFYLAERFSFPRAAKILTISEDTKNDLIKLCHVNPEKILVTPLGYDKNLFKQRNFEEYIAVTEKYHISRPYFINVSSYWWHRKNIPRLIRSFARAIKKGNCNHDLVITGKRGPDYIEMVSIAEGMGVRDRVHFLEYVSSIDLALLINGAVAMVFPSLHEGFGLPIIEAMASGCPVLTSNTSAMPEAAGDAAILIDPLDESALTAGIELLATDEALKSKMRTSGFLQAAKFDWANTAKDTFNAFRQVAKCD
jgi:glycosyltransferase involved in cell wall biosynthesis